MLILAVLLWRLSLARELPAQAETMGVAIAVATLVSSPLTLKFFFPVPGLFPFAFAARLVARCFSGGRKAAANS